MGIPMWKEPAVASHRAKDESSDPAVARRSAIRRTRAVAAAAAAAARPSSSTRRRVDEFEAAITRPATSTTVESLTRSSQTLLDLFSARRAARAGSGSERTSRVGEQALLSTDRLQAVTEQLEATNRTLLGVMDSAEQVVAVDSPRRSPSAVARLEALNSRLDDLNGEVDDYTGSSADEDEDEDEDDDDYNRWAVNMPNDATTTEESSRNSVAQTRYRWDDLTDVEAVESGEIHARTPRFPPAYAPMVGHPLRTPPSLRMRLEDLPELPNGDVLRDGDFRRQRLFEPPTESSAQRFANLDAVQRGIERIRERQRTRSGSSDWATIRTEYARRGEERGQRMQENYHAQERVRQQLRGLRRETDAMRRETAQLAERMTRMRDARAAAVLRYSNHVDGLGDRDRSLSPEILSIEEGEGESRHSRTRNSSRDVSRLPASTIGADDGAGEEDLQLICNELEEEGNEDEMQPRTTTSRTVPDHAPGITHDSSEVDYLPWMERPFGSSAQPSATMSSSPANELLSFGYSFSVNHDPDDDAP